MIKGYQMANAKVKQVSTKPKATARDVKRAAAAGDAIMTYFLKHGTFPKDNNELKASQ